MRRILFLSVGMPRAGSGWHYNIIHDLVVANGGADARAIRNQYHLKKILTEVNCNIGVLSFRRLIAASLPVVFGNSYVIKAHSAPSGFAKFLIKSGFLKAIYIYRDPRDALLSAFEYGQRMRESNRTNAFSHLRSIPDAITFISDYVDISEQWLEFDRVLHVRYEDLLSNFIPQFKRLTSYLEIDYETDMSQAILEKYHPGKGSEDMKGTHFVKGKTGRYQNQLTEAEQFNCIERFGPYLLNMGYEVSQG